MWGILKQLNFGQMKHCIQIRRYRSIREKWRIGDGSGKDEGFLFFMEAWIARWLFVAKVGICRRKVARFPARLATGV